LATVYSGICFYGRASGEILEPKLLRKNKNFYYKVVDENNTSIITSLGMEANVSL